MEALKRQAAARALDDVRDGMKLGLGTGSTAKHFVELLGERVRGGLKVVGVPTSEATRADAERCGIALTTLDEAASRGMWRSIRDVLPFAAHGPIGGHDVWRISTAPSRGVEIGRTLVDEAGAEVLYDWAGGLIWAALPRSDDARASLVQSTVAAAGGHATLIRAPAAVRAKVDVFMPEPAPLAALAMEETERAALVGYGSKTVNDRVEAVRRLELDLAAENLRMAAALGFRNPTAFSAYPNRLLLLRRPDVDPILNDIVFPDEPF